MGVILRTFASAGVLLFGGILLLTFLSPLQIERQARDYLQGEVEQRVSAQLGQYPSPTLEKAASLLAGRYQVQIDSAREKLIAQLPAQVDGLVGQMQNPACACRQPVVVAGIDWQAGLARLQERLSSLARNEYLQLVDGLLHELRIFSASNALAFLLMLLVTLRRQSRVQQMLPAVLLLVAVLISSYFYLFQQNWFFSILFNDYLGYAYAGHLGVVYLLLCDLLLNRARVISRLINRVLDALGSALQVTPC